MKQIKLAIYIYTFLICFFINAQSNPPCTLGDILDDFLVEDIQYKPSQVDVNLASVLNNNESKFLGFIGENKKRLRINFNSIKRDNHNINCYLVEGETTVQNKNNRFFKGIFEVESNYVFTEEIDNLSHENGTKYGFSVLNYKLNEDATFSSTGVFEGGILVFWYQNLKGETFYYNLFDGYDGNRNYQFFGTWKSYKSDKVSKCSWGYYRIPCSGDLDIGAGEFMPNEKYLIYGWKDYIP